MTPCLLTCREITVHFDGVAALTAVNFGVRAGEVHGLVGCNGAGKSTLMRVLAGAVPYDSGEMSWQGQSIRWQSPGQALDHGIAMVYQELSGIESLSVAENLFLGRQLRTAWGTIDWRRMRRQARESLQELDVAVDVRRPLGDFPLVIRQMVEIARGLRCGAKLLILDEPTSALSPPEIQRLFSLIKRLTARGVAVVFISHFLEDVLSICDRVTVLRDSRLIATRAAREFQRDDLLSLMIGDLSPRMPLEGARPLQSTSTTGGANTVETGRTADAVQQRGLPKASTAAVRFRVDRFTAAPWFSDISLRVRQGECLGLYGFVGAGHQELLHALAGAVPTESGELRIDNRPNSVRSVADAVSAGMVLVAADRTRTLVRRATLARNVTLAHLRSLVGRWITSQRENQVAQTWLERVGCRPANPQLLAGQLSGGNQQKVVLAKWLAGPIRVLLLEEPTRGMDVHAKAEVLRLITELQTQGVAVVLASTEPELLLAHADRILTFSRGRITREFVDQLVTKSQLMHAAEREAENHAE